MQLHALSGGDSGTAIHPLLGPVRYSVREIGWSPNYQVISTIGVMGERVGEDAGDRWFRERAGRIIPDGLSEVEKVAAVHGHARGGIRFQRDEKTGEGMAGTEENPLIEVIVRPRDMARYVDAGMAIGDCDDFSMYCAAMLEAVGVPCKFVTVAADGRDPEQFSHVYVAAYPRGGDGSRVRVPVDASHGEYPGWEVENRFGKREEWAISGGCRLLGLASLAAITLIASGAYGLWKTGRVAA